MFFKIWSRQTMNYGKRERRDSSCQTTENENAPSSKNNKNEVKKSVKSFTHLHLKYNMKAKWKSVSYGMTRMGNLLKKRSEEKREEKKAKNIKYKRKERCHWLTHQLRGHSLWPIKGPKSNQIDIKPFTHSVNKRENNFAFALTTYVYRTHIRITDSTNRQFLSFTLENRMWQVTKRTFI